MDLTTTRGQARKGSLSQVLATVPLPVPPGEGRKPSSSLEDFVSTSSSGYLKYGSQDGNSTVGQGSCRGGASSSHGVEDSTGATAAPSNASGAGRTGTPGASSSSSEGAQAPDAESLAEEESVVVQEDLTRGTERESHGKPFTTLMIRNIPLMYTPQMLMAEWPNNGSYDFLYLPYNMTLKRNLTYAFVNFVSKEEATAFAARWQKARLEHFTSRKPLSVSAAVVQGVEANFRLFQKKRLGRVRVHQSQPIFFPGGDGGHPPGGGASASRSRAEGGAFQYQ